jgi:hypothetical protein
MVTTEVRAVDLDKRKQQQAPIVAQVIATTEAKGTGYVAPSRRFRNVEPEEDVEVEGREEGGGRSARGWSATWDAEGLHEEVGRDDDGQHQRFVRCTVTKRQE